MIDTTRRDANAKSMSNYQYKHQYRHKAPHTSYLTARIRIPSTRLWLRVTAYLIDCISNVPQPGPRGCVVGVTRVSVSEREPWRALDTKVARYIRGTSTRGRFFPIVLFPLLSLLSLCHCVTVAPPCLALPCLAPPCLYLRCLVCIWGNRGKWRRARGAALLQRTVCMQLASFLLFS